MKSYAACVLIILGLIFNNTGSLGLSENSEQRSIEIFMPNVTTEEVKLEFLFSGLLIIYCT
jgi:hypothetical protein